ncbi:MAG: hypothetical protein IPO70_04950 [Bacteroidetes bacterium]|nr:hypothetical protein [Bacteroidota bacterium]
MQLEADKIVHLSYQTTGEDKLFLMDENYIQLLKLYAAWLTPVADTYAYCLLPKQIHFLVKIKSEKELFNFLKMNGKFPDETMRFEEIKNLQLIPENPLGTIFSMHLTKHIAAFLNEYLLEHKQAQLKGGGFAARNFKKFEIATDELLSTAIINIHQKPMVLGEITNFEQWKYSSYTAILSDKASALKREKVLDLFGSRENYIQAHQTSIATISPLELHEKLNLN